MQLDVSAESCPSPHSALNKLGRITWGAVWATAFRFSPRIFFGWRRFLLRCFGARIGTNARISPSVRVWAPWNLSVGSEAAIAHDVDLYCVTKLEIGSHATVSQYAHLCTASHDVTDPNMGLTMSRVVVGDQAWICAGAFVGPGVSIGEGAVVGARSVVTREVSAWDIVVGNPARFLRKRELRKSANDEAAMDRASSKTLD